MSPTIYLETSIICHLTDPPRMVSPEVVYEM